MKLPACEHDVALRPATPVDHDFLLVVYASTRAEELAQIDWSDEQKAAFVHMQFEAQAAHYDAHYPRQERFVIEVAGERAGRLYLDSGGKEELRIMDITLLPAFRGRGAGGFLLRQLITEARGTSRPLRIHVEKNNRALSLYERLGFRAIADREAYWFLELKP